MNRKVVFKAIKYFLIFLFFLIFITHQNIGVQSWLVFHLTDLLLSLLFHILLSCHSVCIEAFSEVPVLHKCRSKYTITAAH